MIKTIVIAFLGIQFTWESILSRLNVSFIKKSFNKLPSLLKDKISEEEYKKASDYTAAKSRFGVISALISFHIVMLVISASLLNPVDKFVAGFPIPKVMFCIALVLITHLIGLPFKIYSTFVLEEKFGFNKTTKLTFVIDNIKGLVLSIILMTPLLMLLFFFFEKTGEFWWVYGFALFVGFQFLMLILYPLVIAPLFNKFTEIEDGEVLEKIKALTSKIDFPLKGVFLMDGSKRSSHSNAYFTGIGKAKRIVFFDTLLEKLTHDEILAVLAHELGHFKLNHVKIRMIISSVMVFLGFYGLSILLKSEVFFQGMGYDKPSIHIGMILFMLIMPPVEMILTPLFNMLSRKHEYQADKFSKDAMGEGTSLSEALLKLNRDNLSSPMVHPLYSFVNYSHPPLPERINYIESC